MLVFAYGINRFSDDMALVLFSNGLEFNYRHTFHLNDLNIFQNLRNEPAHEIMILIT